MQITKARITKASSPNYWYAKHIGEVVYIYAVAETLSLGNNHKVIKRENGGDSQKGLYVDADDIEAIETFESEIIHTIEIIRKITPD